MYDDATLALNKMRRVEEVKVVKSNIPCYWGATPVASQFELEPFYTYEGNVRKVEGAVSNGKYYLAVRDRLTGMERKAAHKKLGIAFVDHQLIYEITQEEYDKFKSFIGYENDLDIDATITLALSPIQQRASPKRTPEVAATLLGLHSVTFFNGLGNNVAAHIRLYSPFNSFSDAERLYDIYLNTAENYYQRWLKKNSK